MVFRHQGPWVIPASWVNWDAPRYTGSALRDRHQPNDLGCTTNNGWGSINHQNDSEQKMEMMCSKFVVILLTAGFWGALFVWQTFDHSEICRAGSSPGISQANQPGVQGCSNQCECSELLLSVGCNSLPLKIKTWWSQETIH